MMKIFAGLACLSLSAAAHLYGFVDEFINQETQTAFTLVDINTETGAVTELLQTFVFNGGSAAIDGISALNTKTHTYYWANDGATSFIYPVSATKKSILPPFDSGATSVNSLAVNSNNGDVWVSWFQQTTSTTTVSSHTHKSDAWGITQFASNWKEGITIPIPTAVNTEIVSDFDVNPTLGQLYFAGATTTNNVSQPDTFIYTYNAKTGGLLSSQAITCPILIEYISSVSSTVLRGSAVQITPQQEELNLVFEINPTNGNCQTWPISGQAIITATTYNAKKQELYMAAAVNGGAQLVTFSYTSEKTSVINTNDVFLNIEYAFD